MRSEELQTFYNAYAAWLDNDCAGDEFSIFMGLCKNLINFLEDRYDLEFNPAMDFLFEMHTEFALEGLDPDYPFNGGSESYTNEACKGLCHRNFGRRQWVLSRRTK